MDGGLRTVMEPTPRANGFCDEVWKYCRSTLRKRPKKLGERVVAYLRHDGTYPRGVPMHRMSSVYQIVADCEQVQSNKTTYAYRNEVRDPSNGE